MKSIAISTLLLSILIGIGIAPSARSQTATSIAQSTDQNAANLHRAKNLARQAAEAANGGLQRYRAEPAMYGPALDSPHVRNPDGSLTFTILGSVPGTEIYTIETVVTVDPGTWQITVDYNGALRTAPQ